MATKAVSTLFFLLLGLCLHPVHWPALPTAPALTSTEDIEHADDGRDAASSIGRFLRGKLSIKYVAGPGVTAARERLAVWCRCVWPTHAVTQSTCQRGSVLRL
ncbi:MAG TPA: hypothetical protein VNL14_08155 [Candidatus Acidoferrales bacterium]|nr:hypothetical protein [Candidatus Acidoferrales bacterium]